MSAPSWCNPLYLKVLICVHLAFSVIMAAGIHYTPIDEKVSALPEGDAKDEAMAALREAQKIPDIIKNTQILKIYDLVQKFNLNMPWTLSATVCLLQLFMMTVGVRLISKCQPK